MWTSCTAPSELPNQSGEGCRAGQQSMPLDSGLVLPEMGPREQGKTPGDGGGIQRIQTLVELHARWDRHRKAVARCRSEPAHRLRRLSCRDFRWRREGGASDFAAEASYEL